MEQKKPIRILFQLVIMSYVKVALSQVCNSASYTLIDEPRRSTMSVYNPETDMGALCDDNLRQGNWFRFNSHAGKTIPERAESDSVPMNHCGTQGPIYIRGIGSHPTADGSTVNATVCAHYAGNRCQWTETIQIHRCPAQGSDDGYFIYKLKRAPGCDIAYCAGEKPPCNLGDYWDGYKCVNYFPPMTALPVLGGYYTNGSKSDFTYEVYFTCTINYTRQPNDANARFRVTFLFDGLPLEKVNVDGSSILKPFTVTAESNKTVPLGEYYLKGRLGKQITCQVASYWDGYEPTGNSTMLSVHNYYPAFQSEESSYTFYSSSGSTFTINFHSSIPLTCSHCVGKNETCCRYEFRMGGSGGSSCIVRWKGIGSTQATASVTAVPGTSQSITEYGILFRPYTGDFTSGNFSLWREYTVPPVKFQLIPSSEEYKQCSSYSDPYIKTFDTSSGTYRYTISKVGDYYLTKAQLATKEMEIQVRQETCYWGVCDCGVIVREGNSAYKVSMCESGSSGAMRTPTVVRLLSQYPVDSSAVYRDGSGKSFSVRMPSGLRVEITTRHSSCSWLNIYAYLPPEYHGITSKSSICGDSNGNSNDDSADSQAFRIPDHLNYFRTQPNCSSLFNPEVTTCDCDSTGTSFNCSNYDPLLSTVSKANVYLQDRWTSGVICRQQDAFTLTETTKEASDFILDPEILYPPYTHDPNSGSNISYTWPTASGKLENETELYCREIFTSSASYSDCKDAVDITHLINVCKSDIQRIDEWVPAAPYLDVMEQSCINVLSAGINSSNIYDSSTYSSLTAVSHKMCPQQCSGHGSCVDGKCVCNASFIGTDCSIKEGVPPTLTGIMKGDVCDVRSKPCEVISVLGSGAVSTTSLKCRFYNKDTYQYSETAGTFITGGEYSCSVPTTSTHMRRRRRSTENGMTALSQLSVSVSIDGAQYSNALPFSIYDAKCMDCSNSSSCKKKSNTCLIENECFASNEISYKDPCQKCVPSTSEDSWVDITTYESWKTCSRECDYGAKSRDVICGNSVQATDTRLCKTDDCEDNPSEESEGVGVTLSLSDLEKVLSVPANTLKTFADTISEYCVENGDVCCSSIAKPHIGSKPVTYTSPEQLNYASGYPILNLTDSSLKVMVKIDLALVESQCAGTSAAQSSQLVFADKTLIYEIVSKEKSKLEQELNVDINSVWKPSEKASASALKSSSLFIFTTLSVGLLYTLLFQN